MLNAVYRLVAPRRFEVEFGEVPLFGQEVIVRPTHLSICHADQRYYQGSRPAEVLKQPFGGRGRNWMCSKCTGWNE